MKIIPLLLLAFVLNTQGEIVPNWIDLSQEHAKIGRNYSKKVLNASETKQKSKYISRRNLYLLK